jgi:hypothetical protein
MKAVTPNAFGMELMRYRIIVGKRAVRAMERSVEASDLRQLGASRGDGLYAEQLRGDVERSERDRRAQLGEQLRVDTARLVLAGTAVHESMTRGCRGGKPLAFERVKTCVDCCAVIGDVRHLVAQCSRIGAA